MYLCLLVFVVISIFSFLLILVRIILNVSLLKSINPVQSLSSSGTDHHNHLVIDRDLFSTFERILIKLTLKTWSYILWVSLAVMDANSNSSKPAVKRR